MAINIRTCNLRGIAGTEKRLAIFRHLKEGKHDIILIQETHSTPQLAKIWKSNWGNDILLSHGTNRKAGVAFLLCKHFVYEKHTEVIPGRFQILTIKMSGKVINIGNIYAPNNDHEQQTFFQKGSRHNARYARR